MGTPHWHVLHVHGLLGKDNRLVRDAAGNLYLTSKQEATEERREGETVVPVRVHYTAPKVKP